MARKPRIHFPGALYHVIVRGNKGQKVFRREEDFKLYLRLLPGDSKGGEANEGGGWVQGETHEVGKESGRWPQKKNKEITKSDPIFFFAYTHSCSASQVSYVYIFGFR